MQVKTSHDRQKYSTIVYQELGVTLNALLGY
nr:unnamed protein product [Callosobruchus chinensis]